MKKWRKNPKNLAPKVSVVVAVYNKAREFEMCLEGFKRQTLWAAKRQPFEMIAADDGSGEEIEELFKKFADSTDLPATYLHQKDQGWGKLRMLNWATLESQAEQIIFTDGDCVPHKHFLESHMEEFGENTVLCGRRVDLMEAVSKELSLEDVKNGTLESSLWILKAALKDKIDYGEQGLFLSKPFAKLFSALSKNSEPSLLGSNFSIHKKWLSQVNGFDESFETPGYGEDTDLERRLRTASLKFKWIKHRAIQYHIWHPLTEVGKQSIETFEERKKRGNKIALKGLNELKEILARTL